jgi:hypothetical protein
VTKHFGGVEADTALGLVLRHDHGSNYMSQDFQNEIGFIGIASSPAFVRQPEGNGVAERAIRTLKEQLLWVRHFATVEELRLAWPNSPPSTTPAGCDSATGTRRPIRSGPSRKALKPKPPRSSNWRHNRRKALSQYRAPVQAAVDELVRLSRLDPDWQWRRAAIIAREWRRLEPARAYAEGLGLPVEMANETLPSLWRLREMQAFVRGLLANRMRLLSIADLTDLLNEQPQSRWTDLIGEGIGTLARELSEKAAPVPELVEWLGEWAREARAEQRGLLLLTAHRAKGLEFDHVAILDGGWDRTSREEDADAPRRLFYVAMTRARASLTLLTSGRHPFVQAQPPALLERQVRADAALLSCGTQRFISPDPKLVDLSHAGRLPNGHPSLAAIAQARVGDPPAARAGAMDHR